MKKNDGGSAFPNGETVGQYSIITGGITMRDYFAGQVIHRLCMEASLSFSEMSKYAYQIADAMLAERNR